MTDESELQPQVFGDYRLQRAVGAGGMGQVWAARHEPSETRVAIKILTGYAARHRAFLSAFRSEIRAYAGLHHPSIVRILDRGAVSAQEAIAGGGQFVADSPYVVMEYVRGGSLLPVCGKMRWSGIVRRLLALLDALSHAHARGLVHCDLKPENVLLTAEGQVKLTDFGLVHAMVRASPGERDRGLAGTPRYMSPEQTEGRWRDYGPWTDFYGLGGVAWAMITGRAPFYELTSPFELLRAHREQPPPAFKPAVDVPGGVERWLRRMLAKDPAERYQRASEAAEGLLEIRGEDRGAATASFLSFDGEVSDELGPDSVRTDPHIKTDMTIALSPHHTVLSTVLERSMQNATRLDALITEDGETGLWLPQIPETWRPAISGPAPRPPIGTGLGLYWMREVALVGRAAERDRLWGVLRNARDALGVHVVAITGPAGCGKSRLARWLAERAHEVGGAESRRADFGGRGQGRGGLRAMLSRMFVLGGLEPAIAQKRMSEAVAARGVVDTDHVRALRGLIGAPAAAARHGHDEAAATTSALAHLVEQTAVQRAVVLLLDDVDSSAAALQLVLALQRRDPEKRRPIVVVLTAREEALAESPAEADLLRQVLSRGQSSRIALGSLPRAEHEEFVRAILRLDTRLAVEVEERTEGNPMFALQLVGSWVDRGLLEVGPGGFQLVPGMREVLPDDLHQVWAGRLEALLAGRSVHDGPALELAATWGRELTEELWWELCDQAGLTPSLELLDRLLDEGFARCEPTGPATGWWLAHAVLRSSLVRRAGTSGRLAGHHAICARFLGFRGGPGAAERIARHLLAARRFQEALGPLLGGTSELLQDGSLRRATSLLDDYERAVATLGLPPDDLGHGQGKLLRVRLAARGQDEALFEREASDLEVAAERYGWLAVSVYVTFERACRHRRSGLLDEAYGELTLVEAWARENRDRPLLAQAVHQLAAVFKAQGRLDEAYTLLERGVGLHRALGDDFLAAHALAGLAEIDARRAHHDAFAEHLEAASELYAQSGARVGAAETTRVTGLAACLAGDVEGGVAALRDAANRYRRLVPAAATEIEITLGQQLVLSGRYHRARGVLEHALEAAEITGEGGLVVAARAGLLPCLAWAGDWHLLEQHLGVLQLLLAQGVGLTADAASCQRPPPPSPTRRARRSCWRGMRSWRTDVARGSILNRAPERQRAAQGRLVCATDGHEVNGARGGSRTPTPLRAQIPETCASTNSATLAQRSPTQDARAADSMCADDRVKARCSFSDRGTRRPRSARR